MYYVKKLDENGEVVSLISYDRKPVLKNELSVEIAVEEYSALQAELEARWEEENPTEEETDNISGDEFMQMVEAVL